MNNLRTVREFFDLSLNQASTGLGWDKDLLQAFELGQQMPTVLAWQHLAEYYADLFHVVAVGEQIEPIHFRLSVDYLMNVGMTMNDLLAFKWYFENTRPELGNFYVALYDPQNAQMEQKLTDLNVIFEQFAGYLLLNHDGTMNQFIDERNHNKVSDWRLILYKRDNLIIDVTDQLSYFDYLVNFTVM
ncbi:XRE family transcriptional regulator [Weissella coleopterorum]|uniref:XRE family transcriptional regulator n=1 Tax=Weissella coleopterorum TaxID=2714949 RepID=A0A6G8B188_9LACO|nr:XRE family transcriptional regulator [Weissella coleopterorum]QIL51101.1 XRE family transcriptional regulator [Weissella coleopterorum]